MDRKIKYLALAIFSLMFLQTLAYASVNPNIILKNYSLSETPALPGDQIELSMHLQNIDPTTCASRASVQIVTSYPISIDGNDAQYIGDACPSDNITIIYKLKIDPLARTGVFPVTVLITYQKDSNSFSTTNTINLPVGGIPTFAASVASSNPVDVYAGDKASVNVIFQNLGPSQADSVIATLTAPYQVDVKWAGSTQQLGSVAPRGSATATFNIEIRKDAVPATYNLQVALSYLSENRTPITQTFTFPIPISKKAEFSADTNGMNFYSGDNKAVTIRLVNSGSVEARNLKVRIMPIFPFSTDGTVRYVESLQPGQSTNMAYNIKVDSDGTAGQQVASLLISFEDPQGNKFSDTTDLPLLVVDKDVIYYISIFWPLLVLLAIIIIVFMKRRKLKQHFAKMRARKK